MMILHNYATDSKDVGIHDAMNSASMHVYITCFSNCWGVQCSLNGVHSLFEPQNFLIQVTVTFLSLQSGCLDWH